MSDGAAVSQPADDSSSVKEEVPHRPKAHDEAMMCERCGKAEMYRMHAVWRCPECGFKTDCCGW
jgi:predicted RNA-binding Zn-ribbon protein involved in translation (DUF1610 family)